MQRKADLTVALENWQENEKKPVAYQSGVI
jgi:hypothetical protein